jgi:hypothetical protein
MLAMVVSIRTFQSIVNGEGMPWTKEDYPDSMKNLTAQERAYAISIANGILKSGGDEGIAIATGIARAKEKFGKGAKVAYYDMRASNMPNWDNLVAYKNEMDENGEDSYAVRDLVDFGMELIQVGLTNIPTKVLEEIAREEKIKAIVSSSLPKLMQLSKICQEALQTKDSIKLAELDKLAKGLLDSVAKECLDFEEHSKALDEREQNSRRNSGDDYNASKKAKYFDMRKVAGERDLVYDESFVKWWIEKYGETHKEDTGEYPTYEIAQKFLRDVCDDYCYEETVKDFENDRGNENYEEDEESHNASKKAKYFDMRKTKK